MKPPKTPAEIRQKIEELEKLFVIDGREHIPLTEASYVMTKIQALKWVLGERGEL